MGNSLGGKKTAKVMKITGETFKLKTPVKAGEVVKDYPGHALLESEAVKHYGIRAKPLEPHQSLLPKRLYFLVELPKSTLEAPRRVRSGINMSAKDRLESLMLARRSASDLSIMKPVSTRMIHASEEEVKSNNSLEGNGTMRVKMRLPKAEVEKLLQESRDGAEAAAKIVDLCMVNKGNGLCEIAKQEDDGLQLQQQVHWKSSHGRELKESVKEHEKKVSFLPTTEAEMQIAVASH